MDTIFEDACAASVALVIKELEDKHRDEVIKESCNNLIKLLEFQTPLSTDEDSVLSLQDHETDSPHDTPISDTTSNSECDCPSSSNLENELASLSDTYSASSLSDISTGNDAPLNLTLVPAVPCDSTPEHCFTDREDDFDVTSVKVSGLKKTKWQLCIKCKAQNDNPLYRFCRECFQKRKDLFPPRPKGFKKRAELEEKINKKRNTKICSQDSGVVVLESERLDTQTEQINPKRRRTSLSAEEDLESENPKRLKMDTQLISCNNNLPVSEANKKYQQVLDLDVSEFCKETNGCEEVINCNKTVTVEKDNGEERTNDLDYKDVKKEDDDVLKKVDKISLRITKELCIMCATVTKDSIFLHGTTAHFACCYECAVKTWKTTKCCPVCKAKVRNIVKIYF